MKIKTTVATLSVLSVLSFGAFAADTINAEQAQSRQAIGTVSVGAIGTSPMDMHEMLNKKRKNRVRHLIASSKRAVATTGTLPQNFTNKPSSYLIIRLAPDLPVRALSLAHVVTQLPFQLLLRFIKQ